MKGRMWLLATYSALILASLGEYLCCIQLKLGIVIQLNLSIDIEIAYTDRRNNRN